MNWSPLSLRASVILLAVLCVLAAQAVAASVLLAFPSVPPPAMMPGEVAGVLVAPERAASAGLRIVIRATAPFAPSDRSYTRLVAQTLRAELAGTNIGDIRVHSLSDAVTLHSHGAPVSIPTTTMTSNPAGLRALAAAPFPSFATAARRTDGRWIVLTPATPAVSPEHLRLVLAFAFSLLILTPLTWWSAQRLTRPLRTLALASQTLEHDSRAPPLAHDSRAPPLAIVGPAEVRAAASAFNAMQSGLVRQMEDRVTLMAAIAHDLRTPLTSLRLRAEAIPSDIQTSMIADIARMEALITDLLIYVRGARPSAVRETFDLFNLAADIVAEARMRGWRISLEEHPSAVVNADPAALRRVLENLVENAHRHAGGGRVNVGHDGVCGWILVEDDGPGIPEDSREAVFQPFVRLEASRNRTTGGAGLGLAIARSIARAYGGDVKLRASQSDGVQAGLELPLWKA